MKLCRIISLAFVLALIAAAPVFTAPEKPVADPPKPEFAFVNLKVVVDRWEAVFAEGKKVGSKHFTVSQFKFSAKTNYLFEEVYEAAFGTEKISITRRAQTGTDYMLVAFSYLAETSRYKVENYAVFNSERGETFMKHTVFDNSVAKYILEAKRIDSLPRALPKFAAADIVNLDYNLRQHLPGQIVAYDLCEMRSDPITCDYKKAAKIKIDGKKQTLREMVFQGEGGLDVSYYVEDYEDGDRVNDIRYCRYNNLPISTRAVNKAQARSKSGADRDFVADEYLKNDAYKDENRGIVFSRPSAAWLLQRTDVTDNATVITLADIVGMQTAYCFTVTHIPPGLQPDQIEGCMRRMIANITQGWLQASAPGPSRNFGGLKLYEKTAKMPEDFTGRIGRYFCLVGNGRAVGIVILSPAYLVKAQKTQTKMFLESFVLSKILLPTPPKTSFVFPGNFVRADGYHPSWALIENSSGTGINIGNDILGISGTITGGPQPSKLSDRSKIAMKNLKGVPRPKQNDVNLNAKVGNLSAIEMTSYSRDNKTCYKVYVILGQRGDKYMYRVVFEAPMDVQGTALSQINDLLGRMRFKMN